MIKKRTEIHIAHLEGFLNALQQLCGQDRVFDVGYFDILDGDIKTSTITYFQLYSQGLKIHEVRPSGYDEIKSLIKRNVFSQLKGNFQRGIIPELAWHLFEYYGLISTSINKNGVFNPITKGHVYYLDIECPKLYKSCEGYVVAIEKYAIVTTFCELFDSNSQVTVVVSE